VLVVREGSRIEIYSSGYRRFPNYERSYHQEIGVPRLEARRFAFEGLLTAASSFLASYGRAFYSFRDYEQI
jgi:hypothetical protein